MAITVANLLDADNEQRMRDFAATLTEKDRRRFAAFERRFPQALIDSHFRRSRAGQR